jgi:hypothetical protein
MHKKLTLSNPQNL